MTDKNGTNHPVSSLVACGIFSHHRGGLFGERETSSDTTQHTHNQNHKQQGGGGRRRRQKDTLRDRSR